MHHSDLLQCTEHHARVASTCRHDWRRLGVGLGCPHNYFSSTGQLHLLHCTSTGSRLTTDTFLCLTIFTPRWTAQASMQSRRMST